MDNIYYEYQHDSSNNLIVGLGKSTKVNPHFHHCVEILYITEGAMQTRVNDDEFVAKKDDIVFVHGYARHQFMPLPQYRKHFLVIPPLYSNDFNTILQSTTLPALLNDKEFNHKTLSHVFATMQKEKDNMPALVKKGYLNVILGTLFDHYPSYEFKVPSNIDFFVSVLKYIDDNYNQRITLDTLATTFGYSKYYFSKIFNRYIGDNINNYINMIRLQHFSARYKKEEYPRIADLAFECGFDSLTTFYRYFNKLYNEKPKSFLGV